MPGNEKNKSLNYLISPYERGGKLFCKEYEVRGGCGILEYIK
jgi:hypothetical protein